MAVVRLWCGCEGKGVLKRVAVAMAIRLEFFVKCGAVGFPLGDCEPRRSSVTSLYRRLL